MTAIAGFWSFDERFDSAWHCRAMIAAQSRFGLRQSSADLGSLALGVRLYPLLPEDEQDSQPAIGGAGRFALVADVRLDNRGELVEALALDPGRARRLADSGLLLLALERWGEEAMAKLLGDFAFAFWDSRERRLLLARDPLGQRPLFWHRGAGFIAFSSMPAGLLALDMIDKGPDEDSLLRYLASLPQSGSHSFHRAVERVEPGHVVAVEPDRIVRRRYWRPQRRELGLKRFGDYVEAYRAELDAAVARRLRGAGPLVAAHLSGGWDSNAVAGTAARLTRPAGGRVIAFTHVPRGDADIGKLGRRFADESALASATARLHPNVDHVTIGGAARSPLADLDSYASLFSRPVFNLCNHVWLSQIRSAAAAAGARVLLSGEIGNWTISAAPDTLLADFLRERRWLGWTREASAMLRSGRARLRGVAGSSFGPWIPDPLWRRLKPLSSQVADDVADPVHPRLRSSLAAEKELDRREDRFEQASEAIMAMDWGEYRKGILAGWGLDKRDPTADPRLIDFCLNLPLDMLMKDGIRRPLARTALADRVAPEVLDERRKGYQAADWHEGLTGDLAGIGRLLDAMAANETASRLIDVDGLRRSVRNWPGGGWDDPRIVAEYRIGLLKGLTAGHFIVAAAR